MYLLLLREIMQSTTKAYQGRLALSSSCVSKYHLNHLPTYTLQTNVNIWLNTHTPNSSCLCKYLMLPKEWIRKMTYLYLHWLSQNSEWIQAASEKWWKLSYTHTAIREWLRMDYKDKSCILQWKNWQCKDVFRWIETLTKDE